MVTFCKAYYFMQSYAAIFIRLWLLSKICLWLLDIVSLPACWQDGIDWLPILSDRIPNGLSLSTRQRLTLSFHGLAQIGRLESIIGCISVRVYTRFPALLHNSSPIKPSIIGFLQHLYTVSIYKDSDITLRIFRIQTTHMWSVRDETKQCIVQI